MIAQNDLTSNVIAHSFDCFTLLRACAVADVAIYLTTGAALIGLVPLESMACGKPIKIRRSGGLLESVVPGVTG